MVELGEYFFEVFGHREEQIINKMALTTIRWTHIMFGLVQPN